MSALTHFEALDAARSVALAVDRELPLDAVVRPDGTRLVRRGSEWIAVLRVECPIGAVYVGPPRGHDG